MNYQKLAKLTSKSTIKLILTGILFKKGFAVATDGFKLLEVKTDYDSKISIVVPAKELKNDDTVKYSNKKAVIIRKDGAVVEVMPILDEVYPKYEQLFAKDGKTKGASVYVNRKYLIDLLNAIPDENVDIFAPESEVKPLTVKSENSRGLLMPRMK